MQIAPAFDVQPEDVSERTIHNRIQKKLYLLFEHSSP